MKNGKDESQAVRQNLLYWREKSGHTFASLAQLVGTSASQIHKLETGQARITIDWLSRLAAAMDKNILDFFGEAAQAAHSTANPKAPLLGEIHPGVFSSEPLKFRGDLPHPSLPGTGHAAAHLFALTMGDSSFSRIYPAGTLLYAEPMHSALMIRNGDHIVTARAAEEGIEIGLAIVLAETGGAYRMVVRDTVQDAAPHTTNMMIEINREFLPQDVKRGQPVPLPMDKTGVGPCHALGVVRATVRPR